MGLTPRNQHTIGRPAAVEGVGYWSGQDIRVEFHPADDDAGIWFVRCDLPGEPRIPARVEHRIDTPRRSDLRVNGASVEMVEHVLASLAGLQIDNCEIRVSASEMPGCDGSALLFVDALLDAGIVRQESMREARIIERPIRVGDDEKWIEIVPATNGAELRYELDYGTDNVIGRQSAAMRLTRAAFLTEAARARTFLLKREADYLRRQGLGERIRPGDLLVFGEDGPIDNELRFANECARHKLLDLIGDLALAGCDIVGRITASRSGHHLNAELVRSVLEATQEQTFRRQCA